MSPSVICQNVSFTTYLKEVLDFDSIYHGWSDLKTEWWSFTTYYSDLYLYASNALQGKQIQTR